FNQLASDHTRKELAAIGDQVTDSSGRMRPLIEILSDLNTRTARMTESQRVHALASLFSARAVGGLTAIKQARSNGRPHSAAQVVLAVGSIIALVGAVIAAKAGIVLRLVGLKILGITLGGIVATLLPAIAIFAVLALVVAGFSIAFKRDIGGIRTFFENTWGR